MQYAIEKTTDKRIDVAEALYTRDGGNYCCEVCGQRVHKRVLNQQPFFYHDGEAEVYCTKDTWELEEPTSWHKRIQHALKKSIPDIHLEKYLRRNEEVHRADAYLPFEKNEIIVEVQSSGIDIENVQKRNNFYTSQGKCVWLLNTAKHFASGEIAVTRSSSGKSVIETTNALVYNVVYGRTTDNVLICLQKNENAFVFVEAAYRHYNIENLFGYRVSSTYTWDELTQLITSNQLPCYTLTLASVDFVSIPRKNIRQMSKYEESRYYPQYEAARKATSFERLLEVLEDHTIDSKLCAIALNHPCVTGDHNLVNWNELVEYLITERLTFPVAETLVAYMDEDADGWAWSKLMTKIYARQEWLSEPGLLQYYCAKKSTDDALLERLCSSPNEQVRVVVGKNPHTSMPVLMRLSQDESPDVVATVIPKISIAACVAQLMEYEKTCQEYYALMDEHKKLQERAEKDATAIKEMRKKYHACSTENKTLQEENARYNARIERLTTQVSTLQASVTMLNQQIADANNATMVQTYQIGTTEPKQQYEKRLRDIISELQSRKANGQFLVLMENGPHRWGKELYCIQLSSTGVTPIWFLGYAFSGKTRCDKRYPATQMPSYDEWCRLVTEREAIQIFGEKYYRAPLYQR